MTEEDCDCSGDLCHYWEWCESCGCYDKWKRCPLHCPIEHKENC